MASRNPDACILVGAPVQTGIDRPGCDMGPSAYRAAGLGDAVRDLGVAVEDAGMVVPSPFDARPASEPGGAPSRRDGRLDARARRGRIPPQRRGATDLPRRRPQSLGRHSGGNGAARAGRGTAAVPALAGRACRLPHPYTTTSGNLHGEPLAYLTGWPGFEGYFPPLAAALGPARICMVGRHILDRPTRSF